MVTILHPLLNKDRDILTGFGSEIRYNFFSSPGQICAGSWIARDSVFLNNVYVF